MGSPPVDDAEDRAAFDEPQDDRKLNDRKLNDRTLNDRKLNDEELDDREFDEPEDESRFDDLIRAPRAARTLAVLAVVVALALVGTTTLLWSRVDGTSRRLDQLSPGAKSGPGLSKVRAHVDRLDKRMASLLGASSDPNTAGDVAAQIGALRLELDSVRTCLDVFQRALAASGGGGATTANYC